MREHALRRALLYAAVTATTIASAAVSATVAHADTGTSTITGHLTDAGGNPAAGAFVFTQTPDLSGQGSTTTDATGAYTLPDLPAGEYKVSFRVGGGFTQWAHQKINYVEGDVVAVGAGATAVVDDQLLATGTIAGRLLNRDGTPEQAYVSVYAGAAQDYIASTGVRSDGSFTIELPAGAYKLDFRVRNAFDQWSGGKTSYATAVPVVVTAGQATPLSETVLPTGSIGGRLTNADGTAAAQVQVSAGLPDYSSTSWATTDADGRYRMDNLLLGDYVVGFAGPRWVYQYAHGKLDREAADPVTVADGQLTSVDEAFLPTGGIRIIAHDATTGAPLTDFCGWVTTNSNISGCATGTELVVADVFAGTYHFNINISDHFHFDVPDAPVTVTAGQTATIDVAMRQGAAVTATMVKRAGGAPAEGCVSVARRGAAYSFNPYGFCSDWTPGPTPGTVVLGPLEPGVYQLFADPRDDALGMQWVGATGGTGDRDAARPVTVAAGDRITVPVIRFDKGGTIHGQVTDLAGGAPVRGACVWVAALSPGYNGSGDCPGWVDENGTYSIPGVGPYAWPVEFTSGLHQWRWSGNAANRREATKVTVQPGRKVAANLKLRTGGGALTGVIRDGAGHPLDATVVAVDAVSGEAVQFAGGITPEGQPPATYTIPRIAPQPVKIYYYTRDGHLGWVGGADLTHAHAYQIRNNQTLTVDIVVS